MAEKEADTPKTPLKSGQNVKVYSNRWLAKVSEEKPPFPEEMFATKFALERLTTIVQALKQATEKDVDESQRLIGDNYTYSVQITSHKAPIVNVHLTRILLKHSLLNEDSEVCLFVKDQKRGRRPDYEPTIQHYEKILRANKIKLSISVIPISQLFNEYPTFELRRKLTFAFDKFLVDSTIAAQVNGFLGSKLLNKGRIAFPVNLSGNIADEIDQAVRKVCYKHLNRGLTQSVQVGRHSMSEEEIAENVIDLLRQIGDIHPGGYENVQKLLIRPQLNFPVAVMIFGNIDKPKDGEANDSTAAEATEETGEFDIEAAQKLIQKRVFPYGNIIPDEHLVEDDEPSTADNAARARRIEPNRQFSIDGNRKAKAIGNDARPTAQVTPQAAKKQVVTTPRKANATNNTSNGNNGTTGTKRPARNLNGASLASKAPPNKLKRPNIVNRNSSGLGVMRNNLARNNDNGAGAGSGNGTGSFFQRNNDVGFSNRGSSGNGASGFDNGGFDDFRRSNDTFDLGFTRRSNLPQSQSDDFARGLGLGLDLRLASSWNSNSGGGNSFGRNFNSNSRF